ncbi:TetR/AcrR family transcriptional regulator [Bacillus dakarensis]|uniref:TetR/AcrR family transcriptional regulator n=1 Tax=Robertmurraya dakarensis TaxID=1926278 RepID=UPI0009816055|nr:TetR/AcrR family transcriptional regulator [Bacillus dakarensis]
MKQKITESSIQLFEKKGFKETSIQDIVESLGVTKGTFYYYFSSKEELLMDIHLQFINELLRHQEVILSDEEKSCKSKLYDIIFMLIKSIKKQGSSAKIFNRELQNLKDESVSKIIPKRDQFRYNMEEIIRDGIYKGEFRSDLNPSIVTFGILGMTNWSYYWFQPFGDISDQEVSEIFVEMVLRGIGVE